MAALETGAKTESREERRDAILERAIEVFQQFGLRKTTMEDIAQRSGLKKGSLYYYFRSKEEVIAQVVRKLGGELLDDLAANVAAAEGPRAALERLVHRSFHPNPRARILYDLAVEDLTAFLPLVREGMTRVDERQIGLLAGVLRDGIESGEFALAPEDVERVAAGLRTAIRGVQISFLVLQEDLPEEETVDGILRVMDLVACGLTISNRSGRPGGAPRAVDGENEG